MVVQWLFNTVASQHVKLSVGVKMSVNGCPFLC